MNLSKVIILTFGICVYSSFSFAGFCDSSGASQKIKEIHVHNGFAYIKIEPGLNAAGDATNATLRNRAALQLDEYGQKNIMPLLLMAFATDKSVQLSYCKGLVGHGYIGAGNTLVSLSSVRLIQ